MTPAAINVRVPALHPAQQPVFDSPARFRVIVAGRRFGKSRFAATLSIAALLKGLRVWWVSPTFDLSKRVGWKMMTKALQPLLQAGIAQANKSDLVITLPNGGEFQAKSAHDPQRLVGEGLDLIIVDEAGTVAEAAWEESLRPTLSDTGGQALLIGTPKGRNWFWKAYQKGLDPLAIEWASWQFPTSANPYIQPDEIEAARRELPERIFQQEYLAQFLDDGGAVFRHVAQAVKPAPQQWGDVVMGVDWGRHNDFTVIVALDSATKQVIAIDRFNQIGWGVQRDRIKAMVERYRPRLILAEANSIGEPNLEQLQKEGLPVQPFTTTNQSKAHIIEQAAGLLERGEAGLIDDPVLIHELEAYTMERLPSGAWRYSAPDGGHDDCVVAWALAVEAAGRRPAIARVSSNPFWGG